MNQEAVRTAIARRYRHFADVEAKGRSPLYQRWAQSIADDPVVLDFLAQLPGDKRQPNLLLAAARWLQGLAGSYAELREVVVDQCHDLAEVMMSRRTQTNEPARCATLLPRRA